MTAQEKILTRILALCEAYQNADVEGKDLEDIIDNAELIIRQIIEITAVELAHLECERKGVE